MIGAGRQVRLASITQGSLIGHGGEQALLQIDSENVTNIHIRTASYQFDESLLLIKTYLTERCAERDRQTRDSGNSRLVIDLGYLGLPHAAKSTIETAGDESIYSIRLYRSSVILGPIYRSGQFKGPCPTCLERRWLALRSAEERKVLDNADQALLFGPNPKLTVFALATIWAVVEAALYLRHTPIDVNTSETSIYECRLDTLRLYRRQLLPDSRCPVCSVAAPDTSAAAVMEISSRIKREISDFRIIQATDYTLPIAAYLNPICGILGKGSFADYLSSITAPMSGAFNEQSKIGLSEAWWGGHGNSYHRSQYIGLLEGLERYSGLVPRGKRVSVYDSYENLRADALNPLHCGVYPPEFYRRHAPFIQPFSPDRPLPWVWGYSFREARPILVPEQLVYYLDYRTDSSNFVHECSNGCAAASCYEEAILFGLLELIERDTFLMVWHAKLAPPRIDPQSCRNRNTLHMIDCIDRLGYDLHLFDMRLDMPLPSVMCVAVHRENGLGKLLLAAGSSLDPETAIRAALQEVGSYIPNFVQRMHTMLADLQEMARDYTKVTQIRHHSLLFGLPEMAPHADFLFQNAKCNSVATVYEQWMEKRPQSHDLLDDLRYCLNMVLNLGMDVIVVDQTSPEAARAGLKIVCVIVPGLLPMDFGWLRWRALGLPRLRTVPRSAGFLATDFDPAMSNLVPHPFP